MYGDADSATSCRTGRMLPRMVAQSVRAGASASSGTLAGYSLDGARSTTPDHPTREAKRAEKEMRGGYE